MPACSTAEMWTNASWPPSSGWMKPKPLVSLKNFTVPVGILVFLQLWRTDSRSPRARSRREGKRSRKAPVDRQFATSSRSACRRFRRKSNPRPAAPRPKRANSRHLGRWPRSAREPAPRPSPRTVPIRGHAVAPFADRPPLIGGEPGADLDLALRAQLGDIGIAEGAVELDAALVAVDPDDDSENVGRRHFEPDFLANIERHGEAHPRARPRHVEQADRLVGTDAVHRRRQQQGIARRRSPPAGPIQPPAEGAHVGDLLHLFSLLATGD